jgi:hypothetical protein
MAAERAGSHGCQPDPPYVAVLDIDTEAPAWPVWRGLATAYPARRPLGQSGVAVVISCPLLCSK